MNCNAIRHRDCTDRDCGNNPRRKINRNDYDSVSGFLCDACEDDANDPRCSVCEVRQSQHADVFPCDIDEQD